MKQILCTILIVLSISQFTLAQNTIDALMIEIENNNTLLSAIRKSVEAEKMGNKTGIQLQNPEVEFHYLWGDPSAIGNRTDISVQQSFDFPSAYAYRNQIADDSHMKLRSPDKSGMALSRKGSLCHLHSLLHRVLSEHVWVDFSARFVLPGPHPDAVRAIHPVIAR